MAHADSPKRVSPTVIVCYDLLDVAVAAGIEDFTEGMYYGRDDLPYAYAQASQAEHLLDLVGCTVDSRLLDLGCGYGRLLDRARKRGARGAGITISHAQVTRCRRRGLDVRLADYRDLGPRDAGQFDCLVANGSIEHFVQPEEAAAGKSDAIYGDLFRRCADLLDPVSRQGRLATTVIHFSRPLDPRAVLRRFPTSSWGPEVCHFRSLTESFGGWYPTLGQLARCAEPYFRLVHEEDGTDDYRRTSEAWLRQFVRALATRPALWFRLLQKVLARPADVVRFLSCVLGRRSWSWQFAGPNPPTRLLRQVWKKKR